MCDVMIKEEYPKVGGTPTYVLKCGEITSNNVLILIIPGNPGQGAYYKEFMKALYANSKGRLPVWCVSHAGHGLQPASAGFDENRVHYYGLKDQTQHKLCYIHEYIPADVRLILIGHSIGCYLILQMMKVLDPWKVLKAMLLFPTIERMALSPRGRSLSPIIKYIGWAAPLPVYLIYYLIPTFLKNAIIRWYFKGMSVAESVIEATLLISHPATIRNIANMGYEELQNVTEADYDVIERNLDKLIFYYGASDHWCPPSYYEDMKARFPLGDIHMCKYGFDHAFVLQQSQPMADICWSWIETNLAMDDTNTSNS